MPDDQLDQIKGVERAAILMLALGGLHFFNVYLFTKMRRRAMLHTAPPPVKPDGMALEGA